MRAEIASAGGWSSNSHYPLLGGLRSAAQLVSYEVALALALLSGVMMAGTLSMVEIVKRQQERGVWFVFDNYGLMVVPFMVYLISAIAETNRSPFDLPEAEALTIKVQAGGTTSNAPTPIMSVYFDGALVKTFTVMAGVAAPADFERWRPRARLGVSAATGGIGASPAARESILPPAPRRVDSDQPAHRARQRVLIEPVAPPVARDAINPVATPRPWARAGRTERFCPARGKCGPRGRLGAEPFDRPARVGAGPIWRRIARRGRGPGPDICLRPNGRGTRTRGISTEPFGQRAARSRHRRPGHGL